MNSCARTGAGIALGALLLALPPSASAAQNAECVIPAKADGGFDLTCKLARQLLAGERDLQLSYLPGGIGALAFRTSVTKRPADARSIVAFSSGSLLNLAQGKFGPYTETDVRWLAIVGADYGVIAVRKDSALRSLDDVAKALKADPRAIAFGAGGTIGSQDWFKAALLARAFGVSHKSMRFVAFEGGGDALSALEGKHVHVFTGDAAEVAQYMARSEGVRLLAVLADRRLPGLFANVPTAREQGVDLVWQTARGFYLGGKVGDEGYRAWSEEFRRAMGGKEAAQLQARYGLYPMSLTGPELQRFIADSMGRYRRLAADFELPKR